MDHFGRDKSLLKEIYLTLKFLSCFELEGLSPSGTGPTCCHPARFSFSSLLYPTVPHDETTFWEP